MKKLLLVLAMFSAEAVLAQSTVTSPTAPTVPATVTVSPNANAAILNATTNTIFIDQSGSTPTVNMTQDGNGNKAGSVLSPVYLRGADQILVTIQTGSSNAIDLSAVNPTTGTGVGATITIQQIGDSNIIDAACGFGTSSTGASLSAGCTAADLNWKFTGDSNSLQFRGAGDNLKSAITVTGNSNVFVIDAVGNNHSQTLKVAGSFNEFNLSQTSSGAAGSSIWVDQTGASVHYNIAQSGSIDNVVNIKSVANAGSFNIVQKN